MEKIVRIEIRKGRPINLARAESFHKLLEETLARFHKRLLDAAAAIQAMIVRKGMEGDDRRVADFGLEPEELALYETVASRLGDIYGQPFLKDLIRDLVRTIRAILKVDWAVGHREDIQAGSRAALKRVLRKKGVRAEIFAFIIPKVME